jgi:UDP-N-acetylglucosamine 1-carboxyvinyltransferase
MDKIVIEGGTVLRGTVEVSGAKNAALPLIAGSLLADGDHVFTNVPLLADVDTMGRLLHHMGCQVERGAGGSAHGLSVRVPAAVKPEAPYELVKTMRASVVVLGPLVARWGRAKVSLPGGCAIGARPIDQHLKGLAALGAQLEIEGGYVTATAPRGGLVGARFVFEQNTVTGTENVMMAAALARGRTVLGNCACEPEVEQVAQFLADMGAKIRGAGTPEIVIEGVSSLRPASHRIIPDRIEAGTLVAAAAVTHGDVMVKGLVPEHLDAFLHKLEEAKVEVRRLPEGLRVRGNGISAVDVRTSPHPGFPTDMQAQMMVLMAVAKGTSVITETVFENRFMHVLELQRLGADISIDHHTAVVKGVEHLSGAPVMASDLRASAALVLAGVRAKGTTEVHRVYHLDRGYEHLEKKLEGLGAKIRRMKA